MTDTSTGRPVDGALVVVKWMGTTNSIHSSEPLCYHHEVAATGPDGAFHIAQWNETVTDEHDPTWLPYIRPLWIEAYVFKPGYVDHHPKGPARPPGPILVEPFGDGQISKRLEFLEYVSYRARCGGDWNRKEKPLAAALAAEAIALEQSAKAPLSKENYGAIDSVVLYRDEIEFGYRRAFDLFLQRKKERARAEAGDGRLSILRGVSGAPDLPELALDEIDLRQPAVHTFRLRHLPKTDYVVGLGILGSGSDAIVGIRLLDASGKVLLDERSSLRRWTWSPVGSKNWFFVYKEGTLFTAMPDARYSLVITIEAGTVGPTSGRLLVRSTALVMAQNATARAPTGSPPKRGPSSRAIGR